MKEIMWIVAKAGGAEELFTYIRDEKRPFALAKAYWVMSYPDVIKSCSEHLVGEIIFQMSRALDEMPATVDTAPNLPYHALRLLGNALEQLNDNTIGVEDGLRLLKGLQRRLPNFTEDASRWYHWLWALSLVGRKTRHASESETWRSLFVQIPMLRQLARYWGQSEEVVKESVNACFYCMSAEYYLSEITGWSEHFPESFYAVKTALDKAVETEGSITPAQAYKTLRVLIPRAANINPRYERETVLEAAIYLGTIMFDSATVNRDEDNAINCCLLLLESIEKFVMYRKLLIIGLNGLRNVTLRCPNLVPFMLPCIKDRINAICHAHRGDEAVVRSAFLLVFATNDFEYMTSLFEKINENDLTAVQQSMEVASEAIEAGYCSDWSRDDYLKVGTLATRRLKDLQSNLTYKKGEAYCVHIIGLCIDKAPELVQEELVSLLFQTFTDLWSDPILAYYVLTGINQILASLTESQRQAMRTQNFLISVKQALLALPLKRARRFEVQLRFAMLLLQGIDACFANADISWMALESSIIATEQFLRSTKDVLPPQFVRHLRETVERANGADLNSDSDVATKSRLVIGLLQEVQ